MGSKKEKIGEFLDKLIASKPEPKTKSDYAYLETLYTLKAADANGLVEQGDKNKIEQTLARGNGFAMLDLNLKYDDLAYDELVEDVYGAVEEIRMWVEVGWLENDKKTINAFGKEVLRHCDALQANLKNLSIAHLEYVYNKLISYKDLSTMELTDLLETFSEIKSRGSVDLKEKYEFLRKAYEMRVLKNRAKG